MEVREFLKEKKMLSDSFPAEEIKKVYLSDIKGRKTLPMIKSYHSLVRGPLPKEPVLAVDAGGTNLRFTLYRGGKIEEELKMPMFGTEKEISADDFFDSVAAEIEKFPAQRVGFCFSYPCEILPDKDGKILLFNKEVKISGAEGRVIGKEINKRLSSPRRFSVLNDTVAAQLGTSADAGIILGTGFNICYTDKKSGMIINTESGQFGQLPMGYYDEMLKEVLNSPSNAAEKQISGAYLGTLIRIVSEGYFGRDLPDFELSDVSEFLIGEGPLYSYFGTEEKRLFREIISLLLDRAADRVVLFLSCLLKDYDRASVGLEGSTVYKLPGYYEILKEKAAELKGLSVDFIDARGKVSEGCVRSTM